MSATNGHVSLPSQKGDFVSARREGDYDQDLVLRALQVTSVGYPGSLSETTGRHIRHLRIIVAAIAHLWFESVHPFSGGNSRVGRAVIEYLFASGSKALPFSLSRQIEKDKKAYYAALQDGRKVGKGAIDVTAFVVWFLKILESAADAGRDEARSLVRRNQFFLRFGDVMSERQKSILRAIFAQGRSGWSRDSAKSYSKIAKVSGPTATRDLGVMERAGVMRRSESGGRSTAYWINF